MPISAQAAVERLLTVAWSDRLIRGWNDGWIELPIRLGEKIARITGANPDEVIVADSTSVNLYKLAVAACIAQQPRTRIITDDLNFPSDVYVLQSITGLVPEMELVVAASTDGISGPTDEIVQLIDEQTALVSLSHTAFKSGFTYDIAAITERARRHGALTLWDLSHSVGSVPTDLTDSGADLAVGCTYKYLNGGPGAPAFLFIRRGLQERLANPVAGWMGHGKPFGFSLEYAPATGIKRFLTGTPAVTSLVAMEAGLDLILDAGMMRIRKKSEEQTLLLHRLWKDRLEARGFSFNSPADPARRGSHVSVGHEEGLRIDQALIDRMNVLPDFRAPNSIRLGVAPLYTRYVDLFDAIERMVEVVDERLYEDYPTEPPAVT